MPIFAFGHRFTSERKGDIQPDLESITETFYSDLRLKTGEELLFHITDSELEAFAVSEERDAMEERVFALLDSKAQLVKYDGFRVEGAAAVRRFFERLLGLDNLGNARWSLAVLRRNFEVARQSGFIGPRLSWLYQRSLWLAEKVRIELNVNQNALAVETVIADLAQKIFGSLSEHSALVLAKSEACESLLYKLRDRHLGELLVMDCGVDRIRVLGEKYGGRIIPEEELSDKVRAVDLILECDDILRDRLSSRKLGRLMNDRKGAPLLWASLHGQNGGHLPGCNASNVYYYDRQDLDSIVTVNLKEHQKVLVVIEQLLNKVIAEFLTWIRTNEHFRFGDIIGRSPQMQQVLETIARIAQTDTSVLIDGESGTGKELVARAIHEQSSRAGNPFVVVNCGATPETLLDSELFGHVRGAFTGATGDKKGLFEMADGGTIFLDEIGETTQAMQVKLLRFLQEGELKPVGSNNTVKLQVRVLTATNRNLEAMVDQGAFRQDFYYRLNVIQLTIPPLRDRPEDILPLAEFFVRKYATKINKTVYGLDDQVKELLVGYRWSGNVRELENAMERAVALCGSDTITRADLPPAVLNGHWQVEPIEALSLRELERRHIDSTLRAHDWNYELVTKLLGIGRTTLWRKMKEYDISKHD